ncbi:hypothetical protein ACHAWU_008529 [Discostella pseudostelligera]|uniref:Uncharacterized protein n=1 Tax=Discostella pseudostelligera TaxID=259834 RepID=A0ABD3M041_9STRA
MSTTSTNKAAKQAEAKARAKQWRDGRRGISVATKTSNTSKQTSNAPDPPSVTGTANQRRSPTEPPVSETETPTPKRKTAAKDNSEQYRKTPSSETRADNRAKAAQARARAREWIIQQKKGRFNGDGCFMEYQDLPETDVDEDEETLSECSDDFETANEPDTDADEFKTANDPATNAPTNIANATEWKRDMTLLENDMKVVLDRVQLIVGDNHELTLITNDIRSIYDRMQHVCKKYTDVEGSRTNDLPGALFCVILLIAIIIVWY